MPIFNPHTLLWPFFAPFDPFYSIDFNVPFFLFFLSHFPLYSLLPFYIFPPKPSTDITPYGVRGIFTHIYCTPTTLRKKLLRKYLGHPRISKWGSWLTEKIAFRNLKVLMKNYRFFNENEGLKDYNKKVGKLLWFNFSFWWPPLGLGCSFFNQIDQLNLNEANYDHDSVL